MNPDAVYRHWMAHNLLGWYDRHKRDLPWRRTNDPYAIWLSEVMLQQTQVATVIPYYQRFRSRFLTVRDLAAGRLDEVLKLWAGLGYYARAQNLHRAARMVVSEFGGRFPRKADQLRRLPGVGRYIAGAVASVAFGERTPVVDGNVARVLARLFGLLLDARAAGTQKQIWQLAENLLPRSRCGDFNQALMELGAMVCLPGNAARCAACPLRNKCAARAAGTVADLPVKTVKGAARCETHVVAAIERSGRWLFVQRPLKGLWRGLWEMPTGLSNGGTTAQLAGCLAKKAIVQAGKAGLWLYPPDPGPFCDFQHQLTHRRIRFVGHVCRTSRGPREAVSRPRRLSRGSRLVGPATGPQWLTLEEAGSLGLSRAMQKVVSLLRDFAGNNSPSGGRPSSPSGRGTGKR